MLLGKLNKLNKLQEAKGAVTINRNWCKGCGYCVKYCPTNVLELSKGYNAKGYHPPEVKSAEDCRNCGYCELICPEFAIFVQKAQQEESTSA
jgi:2-oxoglutarate ferredoxin oxidoreductase subunit delta